MTPDQSNRLEYIERGFVSSPDACFHWLSPSSLLPGEIGCPTVTLWNVQICEKSPSFVVCVMARSCGRKSPGRPLSERIRLVSVIKEDDPN